MVESHPIAPPQFLSLRVVPGAAPGYCGVLSMASSCLLKRPKKLWLPFRR